MKNIYDASPIWSQNIMISIYGYKLMKNRYGKEYYQAFEYYKNKKNLDLNEELIIQNNELKKLLKHALENSKFYKALYQNIDISKVQTIDDLNLLPVLEKEMLRSNLNDIYTISADNAIPAFTGGTTGKSLKVLFTKNDIQKRNAYLDAFKYKLGIDTFSTRKATFSGRSFISNGILAKKNIFWRYNFPYKQKLYSTFDMTKENLPFYIDDLNSFKPDTLNGFVSALYEVANYIYKTNIKLSFTPKAIFTTSETLLPLHREVIERAFNCKVYNQYASAEGAPFVTECKYGNLHYNLDTGIIETVNSGEGDEILVTSFTSYGTPLIRYRIGDKIKFKDGMCNCGSMHPLVESIDGRKVDYLYSLEKGKISLSHLSDVIKGMPNSVKNMQFIQNDLDKIIINIVIDEELYKDEMDQSILKEMRLRFGTKTKFEIHKLGQLDRLNSGKFSFIKNNLSLPDLKKIR
jgi:phenylacetate-CoA ligase